MRALYPIIKASILVLGSTLLPVGGVRAETHRGVTQAVRDILSAGTAHEDPCGSLVKECFSYNSQQFIDCLRVSADHPFCSGSDLGALALKRWQMAPSQPSLDSAPALLGPKLINRDCINNFDSQLSSRLGAGDLTSEALRLLQDTLAQCSQETPADLLRP